ncbi:hypothetical protein HYC85_011038 [Camellia sinensis]|uniref:EGF-like domain-containing protein n=1 Tax=Camellia sinensis TaxID=4442 RepID=A0A7J7HM82_CAMSI|nr:hypothetical protein HYC85_011038 [Camellia sinensis]
MASNSILGPCYLNLFCLTYLSIIFLCFLGHCFSYDQVQQRGGLYNSFTVSSYSYSRIELKPYQWRYIRVDLPQWFSSMSIALESDVDLDTKSIKKVPTSTLPVICLREGSPPLPDAYNTSLTGLVLDPISNGSFGDIQGLQNAELCYPLQKNISVILTNEQLIKVSLTHKVVIQISPGVWYWGLFNGIGPARTQSKMTVLRKNPSDTFESYYLPISGKVSSDSADFPLETLLSNSSYEGKLDFAWTYFLLDAPLGAAGGNLHIRLTSDAKINYEIYAKYGGLPSLDSWDYFYANTTSSSNGSMFFKLYDSDDDTVSFYILYVRGGLWSFGLRHLNPGDGASKNLTTMSISVERCPRRCLPHGRCQSSFDASGLTLYSYCSCDRDHGGFDCSVEIVTHKGKSYIINYAKPAFLTGILSIF